MWFANRTVKYALEAKVLQSDSTGDVKAYAKEITENFLKFRYAPFSSEGGMLGYLLNGHPGTAFRNIAAAVPCVLSNHPDFSGRHHKISDHDRSILTGKKYPAKFRCHHLLLQLTQNPVYKRQ
ncbi:MAG: hypothetical protein HC940_04640 [Acaryochloris sp. SU_5_25]|nr:hypothetical protein [Acaryochloris sp. SU_5_25]